MSDGPSTPAAKPLRPRRWAWGLAALALVGLLAAASQAACYQGWGLRALLASVPGLTTQGLRGSLCSGPIQVDRLDWRLPAQAGRLQASQAQIDGLSWQWRPRAGAWLSVRVARLSVQNLQWDSGPPAPTPTPAPTDLRLPLDLTLPQIEADKLLIDGQRMSHARAALSLGAQGGQQHQATVSTLNWDAGGSGHALPMQVQGRITVASQAPLTVQASLQAQAGVNQPWHASLQAEGPLQRLAVTGWLGTQSAGTATAGTTSPRLSVQAKIEPFANWPLSSLQASTQALDLNSLSPRWPHTRLQGQASLQSSGMQAPAHLALSLLNTEPGAWDTGRWPVQALQAQADGEPQHPDRITLKQLELKLADAQGGAGSVRGQGQWQADTASLDLQLTDLLPARLHHSAAPLRLSGKLQVNASQLNSGAQATLDTTLTGQPVDGSGPAVQLALQALLSPGRVQVLKARASAGAATAQATLDAQARAEGWHLLGQADLDDFDPRPWWRGAEGSVWRKGPHRLAGHAQWDLNWQPHGSRSQVDGGHPAGSLLNRLHGQAQLTMSRSELAGVPVAAQLSLRSPGATTQVDIQLDAGGNQFSLSGQSPGAAPSDDRWQLSLHAPALSRLQGWRELLEDWLPDAARQWPQGGQLEAQVQIQGRWPQWRSQGEVQVNGWVAGPTRLQQGSLVWRHGDQADSPFNATLRAQGLAQGDWRVDTVQAELSGNPSDHRLQGVLTSPVRPPAWTENLLGPAGTGTRFELRAQGQWQAAQGTEPARYALRDMQLQGGARDEQGGLRPWLSAQKLAVALQWDEHGQLMAARSEPGRVQLLSTALNWQTLSWQALGERWDVEAELETIQAAQLLSRLQPEMGWGGDLTLGGQISLHVGTRVDADVVLQRGQGDLTVTDDLGQVQALGLNELRLALTAHNGLWQFAQGLFGHRIGSVSGAQVLQTSADRRWPSGDSALQGLIDAQVADLGVWGTWVPPGWRLSGALDTRAVIAGQLQTPTFQGSLKGRNLGLRNVLQGVSLTDGQLLAVLQGDTVRIEQLSFKGGEGSLSVTGSAQLGKQPEAQLSLKADHFRALGRIDRRLVASGAVQMALRADQLRLDGGIVLDEGLIDVGRAEAPALDADVAVKRPLAATAATSPKSGPMPVPEVLRQAQVAVKVGLGQKLRLKGQGLDTLLRGDLQISNPAGRLALQGAVHTQDGRFAAYGQKMDITRGEVTFTGAIDNPRLDVLAIRPNLDVLVGVSVTGTAQTPRIRLYSDPELADYDKLTWLVMGRSPDGLGSADTALLQSAAFALLSGDAGSIPDQLRDALGITDFSVRQSEGDTRDTIISLGRQLSRRWYVGYERGVHATTGTWQLIYRIAQRFTLRAQSGTENAIDLIWSWRW